jgi:GNAT superfamily N-acetyltransferase
MQVGNRLPGFALISTDLSRRVIRAITCGAMHSRGVSVSRSRFEPAPMMDDRGEIRLIFEPKDGSTPVTIRPIRPEDREELRSGFRKLSPLSRYQRFFTDIHELSEEQLDYLTLVDGVNHVALVASVPTADLSLEKGLGVARFVRLPDEPDVAEVAITVVDEAQHKGIGTALLHALTIAARKAGIHRFRMQVLSINDSMIGLLLHNGAVEIPSDDCDVRVFEMALTSDGCKASTAHAARSWIGAIEALGRSLTAKTKLETT